MGALLTAARIGPGRQRLWGCLALIVPIAMHAAYDFPLFLLQSGAAVTGAGQWPIALWITILLITSVFAIGLCNWILPAAAQADRLSRRDLRGGAAALFIVGTGCAFLVIGLVAVFVAVSQGSAFRQ